MLSDFERTGKLQRKIDIFYHNGKGEPLKYACSTNWFKRCKDAKQHWANIHLQGNVTHVRAYFSKE